MVAAYCPRTHECLSDIPDVLCLVLQICCRCKRWSNHSENRIWIRPNPRIRIRPKYSDSDPTKILGFRSDQNTRIRIRPKYSDSDPTKILEFGSDQNTRIRTRPKYSDSDHIKIIGSGSDNLLCSTGMISCQGGILFHPLKVADGYTAGEYRL